MVGHFKSVRIDVLRVQKCKKLYTFPSEGPNFGFDMNFIHFYVMPGLIFLI